MEMRKGKNCLVKKIIFKYIFFELININLHKKYL